MYTITIPVTGCTTPEVAVNSQSAMTVLRVVTAIAVASPRRCVIIMWNAVPSPVPNKIVALRICNHLIQR